MMRRIELRTTVITIQKVTKVSKKRSQHLYSFPKGFLKRQKNKKKDVRSCVGKKKLLPQWIFFCSFNFSATFACIFPALQNNLCSVNNSATKKCQFLPFGFKEQCRNF